MTLCPRLRQSRLRSFRRGFTLLELVVALVVLGILAALAIPTYSSVINSAHTGVANSTALSVAADAVALAATNQTYPSQTDFTKAAGETSNVTVVPGSYLDASGTTSISLAVALTGTTVDVCVSLVDQMNAPATICAPSATTTTLAATPVGYVFDNVNSSVDVINPITRTITTAIPVTGGATNGVLSPSKTTLYVADHGNNSISVIDLTTNTVTSTFSTGVASPSDLAVSPDGATLYIADSTGSSILAVSLPSGSPLWSASLPASPDSLALADSGAHLFVGLTNGNVSSVNTSTHSVTSVLSTVSSLPSVRANPAGTQVWVPDSMGIVYVINAATLTYSQIAPGVNGVTDTAFNSGSTIAYVTDFSTNAISLFNTSSPYSSAGPDISVPSAPSYIYANSAGTYAMATSTNGSVMILDLSTNSYSGSMSISSSLNQVLMN